VRNCFRARPGRGVALTGSVLKTRRVEEPLAVDDAAVRAIDLVKTYGAGAPPSPHSQGSHSTSVAAALPP